MNTKIVNCAKCGKPEEVPADTTFGAETYADAESKLVRGESVRMPLCDECIKAIEFFRKTLGN